ncbi:MAG: type II secretion system F family protein [Breznakia sp.]
MPLKRIGFIKKKRNKILNFKIYEWQYLSTLISKGYTIPQALSFMNMKDQEIISALKNGITIEEIIIKEADTIFLKRLSFFVQIMSLHEAISSGIHLYLFEQNLKRKFLKQSAYPLFIFFFSFITMHLFTSFILPQMMENFPSENNHLLVIITIVKQSMSIFLIVIFFCFLCVLVIGLFSKMKFSCLRMFMDIIPFVATYPSFYLSVYLCELHKNGLSTKQSFHFLCKLDKKTILHHVANIINKKLENGIDLDTCIQKERFLSKRFKQYYALGSASNDFMNSLKHYSQIQEQQWFHTIQKLGITIQIISYAFVGILVICVYQIMLLPLQMLETI